MKKNVYYNAFLILIVIISTTMAIHFYSKKSGLYIDEGMTLFLSNGSYNGAVTTSTDYSIFDFIKEYVFKDSISATVNNVKSMIADFTGKGNYSKDGSVEWYDTARSLLQGSFSWTTGNSLRNQLIAQKGNSFNYIQVLINQALDVHPPLYYIIVHTFFSICSGSFSTFYLFLVNILFLIGTIILLYYICNKWWGNKTLGLLACAIFGSSMGFFSCAVYFRMYAVLTFMILLNYYMHYEISHREELDRRFKALVVIFTLLGSWTHYYFYVFLLPVAVYNVIILFIRNKAVLKKYISMMILSAIISLMLWPFSLYHILFSYRGTEAKANMLKMNFLNTAISYFKILIENSVSLVILGMLVVLCIIALVQALTHKKQLGIFTFTDRKIVTLVSVIFYSFIISKIAPVLSDRYIFCMIPLISLSISWLVHKLTADAKPQISYAVIGGFALIAFIYSIFAVKPNYLFEEQAKLSLGVTSPADYNCITILDDDASAYAYVNDLIEFQNILSIGVNDVEALRELQPADSSIPLVIYIANYLDKDDLHVSIIDSLHIDGLQPIDSNYTAANAYIAHILEK